MQRNVSGYFRRRLLLLVGLFSLAGCQGTAPGTTRYAMPHVSGRSLVFNTPMHQAALAGNLEIDVNASPWYATRNDKRPWVSNGYHTITREQVVQQTLDRQFQDHGLVHDHLNFRTFIRKRTTVLR